GLSAEGLAALVGLYFPHAPGLLAGLDPVKDGMSPRTADEFSLRALLMNQRSHGFIEEEWLAHILARRALAPRPLWQEMGLSHRADLSLLMAHHFSPLAARNHRDMRWKPFFWRELEIAGGLDCQAQTECPQCRRFSRCFDPELGNSLVGIGMPSPA
ncbi:MAG: nitrogen fixation protein NifQ, partial [Magnetospirillum sp.]|nr:nitrogen fixation protein NifQ [Magnetospirillum sp.]